MRRLLTGLILAGVLGVGLGLWLTAPERADPQALAGVTGDAQAGSLIFAAAGCASCHSESGSEGADLLVLAGGRAFPSPFGTFYAPNISPSPQGIGGWSALDLLNALQFGTSPDGQHFYPALPYASYHHMAVQDEADLFAYMMTLPASDAASRPHDVPFPFSIRRGLGLWKLLFLSDDWVLPAPATPQIERGRYLVEALGHCGECHTPRGMFGQLDKTRWMMGADNPAGKGKIPGLAPGVLDWSESDIAYFLETGFTPDFDSAGGQMAEVVANTAKLSPEDRAAIAAYLKAIPAAPTAR